MPTLDQQVIDLTAQTTSLLTSVNVQRATLDTAVVNATAQVSLAAAQKVSAATSAGTSATKAAEAVVSAAAAASSMLSANISALESAASASTAALIATGNSVFSLNPRVVSSDTVLPSGFNAISAGPIEIQEGISVTISDNSTWSIS